MTPEAQRIAIAEACGWKANKWQDRRGRLCRGWSTPQGIRFSEQGPPDYLSNLNAIHEAELTLSPSDARDYANTLLSVRERTLDRDYKLCEWFSARFVCASATADQRAEAFLRTIGKWEDDK